LIGKAAATGIQKSIDTTRNTIKNINQSTLSDEALAMEMFEQNYIDEFTLYTPENIKNCMVLLIKRAKKTEANLLECWKNS